MMLSSKAVWVEPEIGPEEQCFEDYPDDALEDWHRAHDLWIADTRAISAAATTARFRPACF
jgi:hypothetical protein